MDERKTQTKSILKQQPDKIRRGKRLSFVSGLQGSPTKGRDSESSGAEDTAGEIKPQTLNYSESTENANETEVESIVVNPFHKNILDIPVGLCYVPPVRIPRQYGHNMPIVPMKDSTRNIFVTALKSTNSAKVLIIGHPCEGDTIKTQLLSLHDSAKNKWSLKWEQSLEIDVEESPSVDAIINADYFIFLVHLYHMNSIKTLKEKLYLVEKHAMPSIKGTVLYLTSQVGAVQNVVSYECVTNFMETHNLYYIQWTDPHREQYLRLLNNILESTGYYSGLSLLSKTILLWTDKYL
ncbi:uncharacterized protein LOC135203689 [Macrobrachium nipponense]|uniref:uncharacterized protein LOC135203689 n=1 Tax=Macrobrachium nipponense TaxID=159736 RepID=UPI0030C7C4BB